MTEQERLEQERQEWLILLEEDDWASAVRRRLGELERTQEDLARHIGVPLSRVNRHLRGVGRPDDREMKAVARALAYWAKLAYLSPRRLGDVLRPIFSPLRKLLVPAFAAAVALALVPMPAQAATIDWGPGGTAYGAMTPPWTSPSIRVVDSLAWTLRPEHRRIWIRARNQALANWAPGGITFTVERGDRLPCEGVAGAVQMCRGLGDDTYWPLTDGAIVSVHPWAPWWKSYYFTQMIGTIGHEVGHALGFGHGDTGIMGGGTDKPNAVELEALRVYWG